jgi:hypothetical protein
VKVTVRASMSTVAEAGMPLTYATAPEDFGYQRRFSPVVGREKTVALPVPVPRLTGLVPDAGRAVVGTDSPWRAPRAPLVPQAG